MLFYLRNVFLALLYSLCFIAGYIYFLNFYFEYAGYTLTNRVNLSLFITSVFVSVGPVIFYRGLKAISSFISVFIYLILYVPIIVTFALSVSKSQMSVLPVQLAFMAGMCLLFCADRIIIKYHYSLNTRINSFLIVLVVAIISIIYMLYIYRSNLRLVSFEDVYKQRSENVDLGQGMITRYLSSWLSGFMIPLCLAYGIICKKKAYILVGAVACVVIYMATASKSVILFLFIFLGFSILFRKNRIRNAYPILAITLILAMIISLFFGFNVVSSLFWMRTVGNGGELTKAYYIFFNSHPHTYYTHINIINDITGSYPYGSLGLGQVVGQYFWSPDMNANANFWATDGIAAMGILGVLFVSVVLFFVFIVFNAITCDYKKSFLVLVFIPFLSSLLNTSLFSSLWTGGAILMMIFFLTMNKKLQPDILEECNDQNSFNL